MDRRKKAEDIDVARRDAHLLIGLAQGSVDRAGVSGSGRPPGKAMWPAWVGIVSGRLVRTTLTSPAVILVERHQHRRQTVCRRGAEVRG